jgi:putative toxin-antitoxin system antitoxin component (TIGR02293 family)
VSAVRDDKVIFLSPGQICAIVKKGVPSSTLAPLSKYLGTSKRVAAGYLALNRATAMRKAAEDVLLPTHAAESLLRVLELDGLAKDAFETQEAAAGWLRKPHPMLECETPLDCAKSGLGTQRVKDILAAVKYGGSV